jgi:hypothetical protein
MYQDLDTLKIFERGLGSGSIDCGSGFLKIRTDPVKLLQICFYRIFADLNPSKKRWINYIYSEVRIKKIHFYLGLSRIQRNSASETGCGTL